MTWCANPHPARVTIERQEKMRFELLGRTDEPLRAPSIDRRRLEKYCWNVNIFADHIVYVRAFVSRLYAAIRAAR